MTPTPMTPDRERMIRFWHEELARLSDPTAVARRAALGDLLAEVDRLRARVAELEAAAVCPSRVKTPLGEPRFSECSLPVRHRGDHRNAAKNHYWDDEYAAAQGSPEPEVTP